MKRIAVWNPTRDCWETEQFDLLSGLSDVFSETWPRSGMTRSGTAYALPTSEPPTDGSGSSSLLSTLTVVSAEHPGRVKIKPGQQTSAEVMALLPTMQTSDTNGPGHHGEGGMDLRTAITELGASTPQLPLDGNGF